MSDRGQRIRVFHRVFYPVDNHRPYPRIISYAHGNITEFTFARYRHLKGQVWLPRLDGMGGL